MNRRLLGFASGSQAGGETLRSLWSVGATEELVERIRRGDGAAFERLYEEFHRLVYGIAVRMLADGAAAEDIVQHVFMTIWTSPASFAGGNFAAWLTRVTRNRALDVLRSRSRREFVELPVDLPSDDALDEGIFARLNAQLVRSALAELPAEQRTPIELGFFGGLTHDEIARTTATPLGTVKTRIRSGLRKLRAALEMPS